MFPHLTDERLNAAALDVSPSAFRTDFHNVRFEVSIALMLRIQVSCIFMLSSSYQFHMF